MKCQVCAQHPASLHLLDVTPPDEPGGAEIVSEKHLCEACARNMKVPQMPLGDKGTVQFIQVLKEQVRRARAEGSLKCPDCGMTLAEFRNKGRLGCPRDYEVFRAHLQPLLQRVHNATTHKGRRPGLDEKALARLEELTKLRSELERAIREEAYESAAKLRDEIQGLEESSG